MRAAVIARLFARCAAALLAAAPVVELAAAPCIPALCPFSENGKKGRFLATRVDAGELANADATLASAPSGGSLLAAASVNRGELFGFGLSMPQSEQKLEQVVNALRPAWTYRAVPPVRVRIVATTSVVPESFADNVIMVPLGLLMRATGDGQVAWLLGHEFSHIAMAHFAREARVKKRKRSMSQVVGAVDILTKLSQARVEQSGGRLSLREVTDPRANALGDSIWAHSRQLQDALMLSNAFFSRQDEDRADVAGVDFADTAHYPRGASLDALEIIMREESANAALFETIASETTAYAAQSGLARLSAANRPTDLGATARAWLKDLGDNAAAIALRDTKKAYLVQHRPTEKRIEGLRRYLENAYKDAPAEPPPSLALLKSIRALPEYGEAAAAVTARARALELMSDGKLAEARAALQPALATRYGSRPLIGNVLAEIAERQGDLPAADRAYSAAERLQNMVVPSLLRPTPRTPATGARTRPKAVPPAAPPVPQKLDPYVEQTLEGFVAHVNLLVRMNNNAKAVAIIAEARHRFGDDDAFIPALVTIYTNTRQTDLMVATLNRCIDNPDPVVEQRCRSAMLTEAQQKKMEAMSPAEQAKVDATLSRSSSRATGGGLLQQIRDALHADPDEETAK